MRLDVSPKTDVRSALAFRGDATAKRPAAQDTVGAAAFAKCLAS